jgi:hypothetical protein
LRIPLVNPPIFNNRYNLCQNYSAEAWSGADGILQLDDGYIIFGYTVDTANYWWRRIPLLKIDNEGNPVYYKSIGDTIADYYTGWSGFFKQSLFNDEYYIAGSKNYWHPNNYDVGLLMKLNESFDTLWTKDYNLNNDDIQDTSIQFNQMDICSNSDLIFSGSLNGSQMLLLRTDSSGNMLWHKLFHYGSFTLCNGYSVIQTSDNGFALGGFMYTIGQNETGNPVIVKTDSAGNQKWVKFMGGSLLDYAAFLTRSIDGNIIMGSTYGDVMQGDDAISRINIAKLDNEGTIIWDKKYGVSKKYNYLLNIRVLSNGEIIACGQSPVNFPHYSGWILKVDQNGDSLWYREYDFLTGPESRNCLWDVIETFDYSLVACGDMFPKEPDTGNQDAWVIKLDSVGCEWVGCDTTVGIEEEYRSIEAWGHGELEVSPNPARDWIVLTLPDALFPGTVDLAVYNIFGQEVIKTTENMKSRSITLNVSALSSGIYLAVCKDIKKRVMKGKLMVQ